MVRAMSTCHHLNRASADTLAGPLTVPSELASKVLEERSFFTEMRASRFESPGHTPGTAPGRGHAQGVAFEDERPRGVGRPPRQGPVGQVEVAAGEGQGHELVGGVLDGELHGRGELRSRPVVGLGVPGPDRGEGPPPDEGQGGAQVRRARALGGGGVGLEGGCAVQLDAQCRDRAEGVVFLL
jgi:hypothetical protein